MVRMDELLFIKFQKLTYLTKIIQHFSKWKVFSKGGQWLSFHYILTNLILSLEVEGIQKFFTSGVTYV